MNKDTTKNQPSRIRRDRLRQLRNEIDFRSLFRNLGWTRRREDSVTRFVCPECRESHTSMNPQTILARCFRCERNGSPIDFTMTVARMDFIETVDYLESMCPTRPDPGDRPF